MRHSLTGKRVVRDGRSRQYGVSRPMSLEGVDARSAKASERLAEFLRSRNLYESVDESKKRELVLRRLDDIFQKWMEKVSAEQVACASVRVCTCPPASSSHCIHHLTGYRRADDRADPNLWVISIGCKQPWSGYRYALHRP
jgi:hypothetical protein